MMTTETHTETCPVCGKEFERDDQEAAQNSVIGHMVSSKGDHRGIGYETALRHLEVQGLDDDLGGVPAEISSTDNTETVTDGGSQTGPQAPPEPDISEPTEIPERYLETEVYLKRLAEKNPQTAETERFQQWAAKLRANSDFVDLEASEGTSVEALPAEEVPGA